MGRSAATALVALVGALFLSSAAAQITDTDVINFAINLECLEAEFYSWSIFGVGLNSTLLGRAPSTDGAQKATLTAITQNYYTEVANDEINHLSLLRTMLGPAAIPCPGLDLSSSFATVVATSLGAAATTTFSPYTNDLDFLVASYILSDVGLTAYEGAIAQLTNYTNIALAAKIIAVEAYHATAVRLKLFESGALPLHPYTTQIVDVAQDISNFRASIGGGKDEGITNPPANGQLYVPFMQNNYLSQLLATTPNGLAFARTPAEVLAIQYGGSAAKCGGFFPNCVNGKIQG